MQFKKLCMIAVLTLLFTACKMESTKVAGSVSVNATSITDEDVVTTFYSDTPPYDEGIPVTIAMSDWKKIQKSRQGKDGMVFLTAVMTRDINGHYNFEHVIPTAEVEKQTL